MFFVFIRIFWGNFWGIFFVLRTLKLLLLKWNYFDFIFFKSINLIINFYYIYLIILIYFMLKTAEPIDPFLTSKAGVIKSLNFIIKEFRIYSRFLTFSYFTIYFKKIACFAILFSPCFAIIFPPCFAIIFSPCFALTF